MKFKDKEISLRQRALGYLSRREHSRFELTHKLIHKGISETEINLLLDEFEHKGWLSDTRFAESWLRYRSQRGFGPQRIQQELKGKGVDDATIMQALETADIDWQALCYETWQKKFNTAKLSPKMFIISEADTTVADINTDDEHDVADKNNLDKNLLKTNRTNYQASMQRQKKVYQYLTYRGFSSDMIHDLLASL